MSQSQKMDVAKLCALANIELSQEELEKFRPQLEALVGHIQKIAEVDVSGVESTVHGQPTANAFRDDTREPGLGCETFLANAPQRIDNEFKVPRIVE